MMISVIIPVFNAVGYLDRCLQSILNQTFKNIEIILVDDGSTDSSLEICYMYKEKYNNIKVYSQKNSGQGIARNIGLLKAKGNYISFIDSDDYIDKNMYRCMLDLAIFNSADVVVCGHEKVYDENKLTLNCDEYINKYEILSDKNEMIKDYLLNNISSYSCDKLFKRELLIKNNIRFPENCYYEDVNMILKCLYHSKKVVKTDIQFYKYIQRADSTTYTRTEKHLNDFKNQIAECYKFIYKHYEYNEIKIEERNFKFIHTDMLLKMVKDLRKEIQIEDYFRKLPEKLIIFGASSAGALMKYFCEIFDIKITFFCDNSEQKWGKRFNEIEIISPQLLVEMKEEYNIYIASMYYKSIYDQLTKLGIENRVVDLDIF